MSVIVQRAFFLFSTLFIIILPLEYSLLPHPGVFIGEIISDTVHQLTGELYPYQSDSFLFLLSVGTIAILAIIAALIWSYITPKKLQWIQLFNLYLSTYFLSLMLIMYGVNKLFLYQFPAPEPNILYTPFGQLDRDILYWSTMGTSTTYSLFAGLAEIIPGLLLLFKRTRLLGAFLAVLVMSNVLAINIGFDISVKTLSSFLLFLALSLVAPHGKQLWLFFTSTPVQIDKQDTSLPLKPFVKWLKPILILLLFAEVLTPYLRAGYFNGHNQPTPELYGAYKVEQNPENIIRVFFHRHSYFITQNEQDVFFDYYYRKSNQTLFIHQPSGKIDELKLTKNNEQIQLNGKLGNCTIEWILSPLP